jgi:uncharacterized protein (DUF736 family)
MPPRWLDLAKGGRRLDRLWRSNEGRDYLSVKLDDPNFMVPIYANLC